VGNSLRTRESIRYGESEGKTFHEIIESASTLGWHSFDQSLLNGFKANLVTAETALLCCNDKGKMRRDLDLLQKSGGTPAADTLSGLKLDMVAPPKLAAAQANAAHAAAAEQVK
jgi:Tfp pilus assembly ATPase PilU